MSVPNLQALKNELIEAAKETTFEDMQLADPSKCIDDIAGGNVDDAYWRGYRDGATINARDILEEYFGITVVPKDD